MMSDHFEFEAWETPEEAGVSSAGLLRFLEEAALRQDTVQYHSLVLLRHGKTVARWNWAPYDDRTPHTLFSLSKSFCSAAAGFAVQEGLIAWDTSVVDVLPEEIPEGREEELRQVTLETLLCMGSGLDPESDTEPEGEEITWARHVLSYPVLYPPMTRFHYNTHGTYLVACMLAKVTGTDLVSYLKPRLFDPLGIPAPYWEKSPQGICIGGYGLYLSSDSIARFGQCLLQHGQWEGQQILPPGWVERATAGHIDNSNGNPEPDNEWHQGYGYQFWRCTDGRYRGDGMFGQLCVVDERLDAVAAVTCGTNDMAAELRLLRKYLFPAFDAAPGTVADQEKLAARACSLGYPCPADDGSSRPLPDGEYALKVRDGEEGCIRLDMDGDLLTMTLSDRVPVSLGRGRREMTCLKPSVSPVRWLGAYGWQDGRLLVDLRTPDGPFTMQALLDWDDDGLTYEGLGMGFPNGTVKFERKNKTTDGIE